MSFSKFEKLASNRLKFGFFLLAKLPSAWLCGVRLRHIDRASATATVPFKWLSQNPFRSTYFACQAMAAELSTGVLALGYLHQRQPAVSMLVTRIEMRFHKKATSRISFTCRQGAEFEAVINKTISSQLPQTFLAKAEGTTAAGELVSEFLVEWSFKTKTQNIS